MDNIEVAATSNNTVVVTFVESNFAISTQRSYQLTNNVIYTFDDSGKIAGINIFLDTGTVAEVFLCSDPSATLVCSSGTPRALPPSSDDESMDPIKINEADLEQLMEDENYLVQLLYKYLEALGSGAFLRASVVQQLSHCCSRSCRQSYPCLNLLESVFHVKVERSPSALLSVHPERSGLTCASSTGHIPFRGRVLRP